MKLAHSLVAAAWLLAGCSSLQFGAEVACDKAAEPTPLRRPSDLRIVSFNLHGPPLSPPMDRRIDRIAAELRARQPDLILLQEVWFERDERLLKAALEGDYLAVTDDAAVALSLRRLLIGLRKGGLMAFVRPDGRWHVSGNSSTFHAFSEAAPWYRFYNEGDGASSKGIQRLELQQKLGGRRLVVYNVHMQSQYGDRRYVEVRQHQVSQLNRLAALDSAAKPSAQLAFGDFNTMPERDEEVYSLIEGFWRDLTVKLRAECRCDGTNLEEVEGKVKESAWLDYALVRPASAVDVSGKDLIKSETIDCPFSDHYGLDFGLVFPR